jgi:DNA-binding CsgD family transcriptional regulator
MRGSEAELVERLRWDILDSALATLRLCRSAGELTGCATELARTACEAEAAALGRVTDGVWRPWLQAGDISLLEPGDTVPSDPVEVDDTATPEQQVIRFGRTCTRRLPASSQGRQMVVAAVACDSTVLGLLQVVGRDLDAEIVETFAAALGSLWGLMGVRQRAEEQGYVLTRLRNALGHSAERPIELVDATPDPSGGLPGAVNSPVSSTVLRSRLTARQREVLDLMMAGLSNAEIAERLVVALPTVKSHVRAVLRAIGAVNRSDAVAQFARIGGSARSPLAR